MVAPLRRGAAPHHKPRDYSQTPLNVYWEVTQACALACRHCRAEAVPHHHPLELTHDEGRELLKQIADFGDPKPYLILTGGDPLDREDLYELIDEARRLEIGVSITPAATEALTRDVLVKLNDHGVEGLGLRCRSTARTRPRTTASAGSRASFIARLRSPMTPPA